MRKIYHLERDFQNLFGIKHNILHISIPLFNTENTEKLPDFSRFSAFLVPMKGKSPKIVVSAPPIKMKSMPKKNHLGMLFNDSVQLRDTDAVPLNVREKLLQQHHFPRDAVIVILHVAEIDSA